MHGPLEEFETDDERENFRAKFLLAHQQLMDEVYRTHR